MTFIPGMAGMPKGHKLIKKKLMTKTGTLPTQYALQVRPALTLPQTIHSRCFRHLLNANLCSAMMLTGTTNKNSPRAIQSPPVHVFALVAPKQQRNRPTKLSFIFCYFIMKFTSSPSELRNFQY